MKPRRQGPRGLWTGTSGRVQICGPASDQLLARPLLFETRQHVSLPADVAASTPLVELRVSCQPPGLTDGCLLLFNLAPKEWLDLLLKEAPKFRKVSFHVAPPG